MPFLRGTTPAVVGGPGPANKLTVRSVNTLPAGSNATFTISGDSPNQIVDVGIPTGSPGNNATTTNNATQSSSGLMSAQDKVKLDAINSVSISPVSSGARAVGAPFTISQTRNSLATYTFGYTLTSTLSLGQTILIVVTVDGVEVARMADGILLGLSGNLQKTKSVSFTVPAGKQVLFTKSGTSSVTATVVSGQETLL
ncbi:hypothetical protein ACTUSX_11375 [Pantoea ananatis]|uniref:hypothetical protein n=1 Tax=Pantoea ananas TaxID=553 RepID=UPI003FA459FA